MNRSLNLPVLLVIYGLCLPLAVFVGYLLANPTSVASFSLLSMMFLVLALPLFLRWHHALLIFTWNSAIIVFFLPGQPNLGILLAVGSFAISLLNRILDKRKGFIRVPSVTLPLLFFAAVVVATSIMTGGIGARTLGSELFGGRKYLTIFWAIIGYFALTAQVIPENRRVLMASLFFVSGATSAFSDLIYLAGPNFYFLFAFFSANLASMAVVTQETLQRFSGLAWGTLAVCYFLLLRFGVSGLFDLTKAWRLGIFLVALTISLLGGFRSTVIILSLLFIFQFLFEGGLKSRLFPVLVMLGVLVGTLLVGFVDRLPLSIQRSFSFLPLNVHPMAKQDAMSTLDWRLQIWKTVLPEVPQYFFKGKGFGFSGTDLYLTEEAVKRGMYQSYEDTLVSGNYHNGILTTIIPFGIFGLIGFMWFCWAALKVLYANYRHGPDSMSAINTFLLAFFVARLVFFVVFYGQLDLDLMIFTGTVGLSVALNGGVRTADETSPELEPVLEDAPEPELASLPRTYGRPI